MASKGRPYRTTTVEGFDILIGKGDRENDHLTFEVAEPDDFWLHVSGGTAGSHVIIRNPDHLQQLPKSVIEQAAALAAWHSKARNARRVDVHVCRAKDVTKERGAPTGQVTLRRWNRVRVQPSPPNPDKEEQ